MNSILEDLILRGGRQSNKQSPTPSIKGTGKRVDGTPQPFEQRNAQRMAHAFGQFAEAASRDYHMDADPEFDYLAKAEQMQNRINRMRMQAAAQRAQNRNISVANSRINMPNANINLGGMGVPKGNFGAFIQAISGQESGGNYGVVNKDSGALGKYQILPSNLTGSGSGWDYEALGRDVNTTAFLNNPRMQERIARYKLRQYFDKYGAAGAASAWYSGDPNKWRDKSPQGGYPSIYEYVQDILRAMGR